MMKRLLFVCTFIFAAAATFAVDIGTALDQAAEQFSSTLRTGTTVAIVGIASDTDDMSEYMLDELTLRFVQQRRLTVANRANLDAIKQEMNFQLSGEVSDASMQEIGAMAGAETVIHGSLREIGSSYFLSLQALNVTTATVEDMYRETVTLDEFAAALLGKTITLKGSILDINTDYTSGERISLGFQNLVFGLGAYRAGYVVDGVLLTVTHIAGYSCMIALGLGDPALGLIIGGPIFAASALYGFIRPIFYHKPGVKVGAFGEPDGLRFALVPFGENPVMQVSYRKSF